MAALSDPLLQKKLDSLIYMKKGKLHVCRGVASKVVP
jgi:hypothetical protein